MTSYDDLLPAPEPDAEALRAENERLHAELEQLRIERNIAVNAAQSRLPDFDVQALAVATAQREAADARAQKAEAERDEALADQEIIWRERDALAARLQAVRELCDQAEADPAATVVTHEEFLAGQLVAAPTLAVTVSELRAALDVPVDAPYSDLPPDTHIHEDLDRGEVVVPNSAGCHPPLDTPEGETGVPHNHVERVPGCFRCDLSAAESPVGSPEGETAKPSGIVAVEFYKVVCTACRTDTGALGHEYAAWSDKSQAQDDWESSDGVVLPDGRAYCDGCLPPDVCRYSDHDHRHWFTDGDECEFCGSPVGSSGGEQ